MLLKAIPPNYCRPNFLSVETDDRGITGPLPADFDDLVDELAECRPQTWIVTGGPGSGKTSLTSAAATGLLDQDVLPVVLDWRMLARHEESSDLRALMNAACPDGTPLPLWKSRVKHGRCVVIIDGLNEIARQYRWTACWRFVMATVEGGHPYPVLATTRGFPDEPQPSLARPMHRLELAPLTSRQIATYLRAAGLNPDDVDKLHGYSHWDEMCSNPLLLSMLARMLDPRSADRRSMWTPTSRGGLFRETMHRVRRGGRLSADEAALERAGLNLESVMVAATAWVFGQHSQAQVFSRSAVERLLAPHWPSGADGAAMIDAFLDTQLVVRVEGSADEFKFAHPSFVDFGIALAHRGSRLPAPLLDSDDLVHCLGDWVGLTADPDESARSLLSRQLRERGEPAVKPTALVDVVTANRGVLAPETQALLWREIGLHLPNPRWQSLLIQELNQLPDWIMAEAIDMGLMGSWPDYLRSVVWDNPGAAGFDGRKLRQGRRRLRNERTKNKAEVKKRAFSLAQELGATGVDRAEAISTLKAAFGVAGPDEATDILKAIMWIGNADEVPFCTAVLDSDQGDPVRSAAVEMLGLFGVQPAMDQLMVSLRRDRSAVVRAECARALGRRQLPAALGVLTEALSDPAEGVRGSAARALGVIRDARAVAPLLRCLKAERDYGALAAIAGALGRLGDPAATPDLVLASTETATHVRAEVCQALGEIGDRDAVPALARRLHDADGRVRGRAMVALGRIGDRAATPDLIDTLAHPDGRTRAVAANALAQIRDRRAVEPLVLALADVDPYVRGAAAAALGRFPDKQVAARLNDLATQDPSSAVRSSAISSLGRIGGSRDLPMLERVIRDPANDYWLRAVAVMAYSSLTRDTPTWLAEIADALRFVRDDSAQKLRGTIVFCVGRHCNIELVGWLEAVARQDQDTINRTSAMVSLVQNGCASERFLGNLISDCERAITAGRGLDVAVYNLLARELVRRCADSDPAWPAMLVRFLEVVLVRTSESADILIAAINGNDRTDSAAMPRVLAALDAAVAAQTPDHPSRPLIAGAIQLHVQRVQTEQALARLRSDPASIVAQFRAGPETSRPVMPPLSSPVVGGGSPLTDRSCDLLVITVNSIETEVMRDALRQLYGPPELRHAAINSYWSFAQPGFPSVVLMRCGMGAGGTRGAYTQVGDAIRDLSPAALVAAGVAWGRDVDKTPLGAVLVSTHVLDFERQRVGEDALGRPDVISRGARTEASPRLMNRFLMSDYSTTEVSIIDGPLLSGEKLIDNAAFKRDLLERFPEAIGGEMEGIGVQSVCDRMGVDWLVVKGVCDFAENKGEDKTARQNLAAMRAAEAICTVIRQGGFNPG